MPHYDRPLDVTDGLRLHLNENTAGCSPAVVAALRALTAERIGRYPGYDDAIRACAEYYGVGAGQLLLCNGLDEGLLATALTFLRPDAANGSRPEAIIPEPAFDLYAVYVDVAAGRAVTIAPGPGFRFQRDAVLAAIGPRTRLIFLTNPNNPTGTRVDRDDIRAVATAAASAVVVLDEAYADFAGETFLDDLSRHPNVIIGRTFAKSHGLAGLRLGCLIGAPETIEPLRRVLPVYNVNAAAAAALPAALGDRAHAEWYLDQVRESKRLFYAACDRLGLAYVPSAANFVLVHAGERAELLLKGLAARKIYVRDRSTCAGCAGHLRIVTGLVRDTERCIAAMEEILCGAP